MRRAAAIIFAGLAAAGFAPPKAAVPPPKAAAAPAPSAAPQLYVVEQLVTQKLGADVLEKMKPLDTLLQVEELLKAKNIPFQWQRATFDPAKTDPQLLAQIQAVPPGEVFVVPGGDRLFINRIIGRATAAAAAAPAPAKP